MQFTFCMTVANGALAAGAALFGLLRNYLDWQAVFIVVVIMTVFDFWLLRHLKVKEHVEQVKELELNYLRNEAGSENGFSKSPGFAV